MPAPSYPRSILRSSGVNCTPVPRWWRASIIGGLLVPAELDTGADNGVMRFLAIGLMLLSGCGGSVATATNARPSTVAASPSASIDLAVCEVYREAADHIREAANALLENAIGSGPSRDVIGPITAARGELGLVAVTLVGEERADVEALSEDLFHNTPGVEDDFHAQLLDAWGTFYRKYAEPCGQSVSP